MHVTRKVVLAGSLAALASAVGQASAATHAGTFVRCSWRAQEQGGHYQSRGTAVGVAKCASPFGTGRYSGKYQDAITPPTAAETASLKLSFDPGSVHGSYHVSGPLSSAPYHGILHIAGGTGRFKHVTGTLQISCTGPWTVVCHASGTVTGL